MDCIENQSSGDALRETFTPADDAMDDEFARLLAMVVDIEADDDSDRE